MQAIAIVRADQPDGHEKLSRIKERLSLAPMLLSGLDAQGDSLTVQVQRIIADVRRAWG